MIQFAQFTHHFDGVFMNRLRPFLLLFLAFWLVSCDQLPPFQDARQLATGTPAGTIPPLAPPTPIPDSAEGIGRAFYKAWEAQDYLGMYSLLAPQSQALINGQAFVTLYEQTMETAAVQAIHTQPLAAIQNGAEAQMEVRVTWDSAVVGSITRDHTLNLQFQEGRWGIIWRESLILPELQGGQQLQMSYRIPARANIYDLSGRALAYQGSAITLGVVPGRISDEAGLLNLLSTIFNRNIGDIREQYATAPLDWFVPIGDISPDTMSQYLEALTPYLDNGLATQERLTRIYPENGIAPHIVGYIGAIPAEELKGYHLEGYRGDERIGLAGIEGWGEPYLRGTRGGVLTIVGANGEYLSTVAETEPRQARSIYTTLDYEFQAAVEQILAQAIQSYGAARAGSIVVMDVHSGAIRAMASYPSYNPAIFDNTRPDSSDQLNAILNDFNNPLLNRATQGVYPAGSTFKIVTFAAGMNSGLYNPNTLYVSNGSWNRLGDAYIKYDWREGGHGTVTMAQALTVSCNSCFYDMGYNVDALDTYLFPNIAHQFGLGQLTNLEGIAESSGLIPDPDWKLATYGEGWARGDAVNMAIGQGFVQVTPLQMVNMIAAVANGGTLYRPQIIDRIGEGGGAPVESWPLAVNGQLPLTAENLAAIQNALYDVTTASYGTATHRFQGLVVPVAGKTGTAEAPGSYNGQPHAWFVGYAPAGPYTRPDGTATSTPEIAIVVMIENGGEGSAVAAPIFRRVIEQYYHLSPITPYPWGG